MKKNLFILTLILVLSTSLLVSATPFNNIDNTETCTVEHEHSEHEEDVMPIGLACDCGGSYSQVSSSTSPWYVEKYVQCKYNTSKVDSISARTITKIYRCNKCGLGYDDTIKERKDSCSSCTWA